MVDVATMRKLSNQNNKMSAHLSGGGGTSSASRSVAAGISSGGSGFARTCAESAGSLLSRLHNNSTPSSSGEPDSPTTNSAAAANLQPIPSLAGTPLEKHFELFNFVGLAGNWKLFSAQTRGPGATATPKDTSVLIYTKKDNVKASARIGRNRLGLLDLLKYGANQLASITHPRILRLMEPLSENKELIGLATEPIFGTLSTFMEVNQLEKLEIKLGVLQLIEAVSYLHNSAKILHGNLNPSCVYVATNQQWKLGGFEFSVPAKKENQYPCYSWTKKLPLNLQPDLDFLAPEYLVAGTTSITLAADVFSLGVLICWIYAGGKKLIDCRNNLDSYAIVVDQLDAAIEVISDELGANLKESLLKLVSKEVDQRPPVQMLALIKHFDDPTLAALRQLDDISSEFDPAHKSHFLSQTLLSALSDIPETLWFSRILQRFNENLWESQEAYSALLRPLTYMLSHCESHNIHKLRPWFRRILEHGMDKSLVQSIFDQMPTIFRRLNDEFVEDRCFDLIMVMMTGEDQQLKQSVLRLLPNIAQYVPLWFINKKLIPAFHAMNKFFEDHVPRQIDLLVAVSHLSDRCDINTLNHLLSVASLCDKHHPAIVHSKSRLVQRILTCDVSRLRNSPILVSHLLAPLVAGLALQELSPSHFDDVMSSVRILLDIIEQIRYENDDSKAKSEGGGGRLGNRRVSMSSNHLPRLLITAARPSFGGDGRKMSFLSADGRLEDRRTSKDSRGSFESDVSLRIGGGGSDVSDESNTGIVMHSNMPPNAGGAHEIRRKSWLEGYMHSVSLEQSSQLDVGMGRTYSIHRQRQSERRSRTRSPIIDAMEAQARPARPNSFTNLGHNLACTLWKKFY